MRSTSSRRPPALIPPRVRALRAYVPGEQPRTPGLIKLNTNENPYPPAPGVLAATRAAVDGRLRLYPDPTAEELRRKLARLHRCRVENILVGNGSDELLALAVRAFVEPAAGRRRASPSRVQFFHPSYSLYPVLAAIHGATANPVPLDADFALPTPARLRRAGRWDFHAALTFETTPHAPSGRGYRTAQLAALCRAQRGVIVLDEAYVDFAREQALAAEETANLIRARQNATAAREALIQRLGLTPSQAQALRLPDQLPALPEAPIDEATAGAALLDNRLDVRIARTDLERTAKSLGLTQVTSVVNGLHVAGGRNSETGESSQRGFEVELLGV